MISTVTVRGVEWTILIAILIFALVVAFRR
jgi:hypothetical protein